jgi:hypothetical protein
VLEALYMTLPEEIKLREHALRQLPVEWCVEDDNWFPDQGEPDTTITTATHHGTDCDQHFRRLWIMWNSKRQHFVLEHFARPGPLRFWQIPSRKALPYNSRRLILQKRGSVWHAGAATTDPFERIAAFMAIK